MHALKPLRPHQDKALQELHNKFAQGARRVLLYAPPGTGKTLMAAHVTATVTQASRRLLFIAHRRELIMQASGAFHEAGIEHGIIMGNEGRERCDLPVQIATIQTLRNRMEHLPPADTVVIDEAHLAAAPSYMQVLDNGYPEARRLGLSGTPERLDGQGLRAVFDDVVVVATTQELVDKGFLVAPTVYAPAKRLDLSKVQTVAGEYSDRDLDKLMNTAALCGDIVDHWHQHAAGQPTLVFAVTQSHSQRIVDQFLAVGVSAAHVDCTTPKRVRDSIFASLRSGKLKVVVNVDICTEGFDFPALVCVILARPTRSFARFAQAIGRGMRTAEGKKKFICLDHAGSVLEHGFPTDPREITLDGEINKDPPSLEECPQCKALIRTTSAKCISCGWVRPLPPNEVDEEREAPVRNTANDDGELKLLKAEDRPQCPVCHSYQVRVFRNPKLGKFTSGVECFDRRCRKTNYVVDHISASNASGKEKLAELRRLEERCAHFRGPESWPARQFTKMFGHAPTSKVAS